MADEIFCDGFTGQWAYAMGQMREVDGLVSVSAEIRHSGTVRCKRLLTEPAAIVRFFSL